MNQKNDTLIVVLLVLAGLGYAWHTGELQIPGDAAPDVPAAVSSVGKSDLYRALAETVEANRVEDTDRLLSIAENVGSRHGLDVKPEIESKCQIQPGKPKALTADPAYGKQVAEQLRQLGGG